MNGSQQPPAPAPPESQPAPQVPIAPAAQTAPPQQAQPNFQAPAAPVPPNAAAQQQVPGQQGQPNMQQLLAQTQHRQQMLAMNHQPPHAAPQQAAPGAPAPQGVPSQQQAPSTHPSAPNQMPVPTPSQSSQQMTQDPMKQLPIRAYLDQTVVPILLDGTYARILLVVTAWGVSRVDMKYQMPIIVLACISSPRFLRLPNSTRPLPF